MEEQEKPIRYFWDQRDGKNLGRDANFESTFKVPFDPNKKIFVNILSVRQDETRHCKAFRVRLYYANGSTVEGWCTDTLMPIHIMNEEELFDGRFNT